ncbi:MAG: DUF4364 family protein [Ruminococcaceae bacterium]|nr:DUF4364 family protein [Oscillospiraceae bacterium]
MTMQGFSAGVEPGGLYRMADIQLLICYMLSSVKEALPRTTVMDIVAGGGMANFFETTEALEGLLTAGSVTQSEDTEQLLTLEENGRVAVQTLHNRLPLTLRERSAKAAIQALARRHNERDSDVIITDLTHGCTVTCAIRDEEAPLLSLSLKVGDHQQADYIREHFLDDSGLLYRSILSILTGRAEIREEDGRTVIHVL